MVTYWYTLYHIRSYRRQCFVQSYLVICIVDLGACGWPLEVELLRICRWIFDYQLKRFECILISLLTWYAKECICVAYFKLLFSCKYVQYSCLSHMFLISLRLTLYVASCTWALGDLDALVLLEPLTTRSATDIVGGSNLRDLSDINMFL